MQADWYSGVIATLGVDHSILDDLGFSASSNQAYGQLLQALPPERGIEVEFWRSLPGAS